MKSLKTKDEKLKDGMKYQYFYIIKRVINIIKSFKNMYFNTKDKKIQTFISKIITIFENFKEI